jgi:hypothetical protein
VKVPDVEERLSWAMDFKWPASSSQFVEVAYFQDKEKRLYRAALDAVAIISEDIRKRLEATIYEIEFLLHTRTVAKQPKESSLHYLYLMEIARKRNSGRFIFLEHPFRTFYGLAKDDIVQLYEIHSLTDLFRFEFVKMIEHDIFIKKCKNCGHFFIPRGRPDAEYCHRLSSETGKRCNEVGAMIQYEKKVSENPVLEMHKKAYRRFNSRARTGKMTHAEFLTWTDEAAEKRDKCLAGELSFDEFVTWLEQGRIRKARNKPVGKAAEGNADG